MIRHSADKIPKPLGGARGMPEALGGRGEAISQGVGDKGLASSCP
jgi:hypothetical protein